MADDFLIDEAQVIYLTTHRQNTIDVVSMNPGLNSGFTQSIAGEPWVKFFSTTPRQWGSG